MLKYVFDSLKLTEFQVTPKAIMRLRVAAILGIPAIPCFAVIKFFNPSSAMTTVLGAIGFASLLALFYVGLSRVANRFYSPNRYLDEWEINKKEAANSFAFLFVLLGLSAFATIFGLYMLFAGERSITLHYTEILWCAFYVIVAGMSAQFIHLIFSLEALGDVQGPKSAEIKIQDWRWRGVATAILLGFMGVHIATTLIIPLGVMNAADRAVEQCGKGNVKSMTGKGYFKIEIICFDESKRKP